MMKNIIYTLFVTLFLFGCSSSENMNFLAKGDKENVTKESLLTENAVIVKEELQKDVPEIVEENFTNVESVSPQDYSSSNSINYAIILETYQEKDLAVKRAQELGGAWLHSNIVKDMELGYYIVFSGFYQKGEFLEKKKQFFSDLLNNDSVYIAKIDFRDFRTTEGEFDSWESAYLYGAYKQVILRASEVEEIIKGSESPMIFRQKHNPKDQSIFWDITREPDMEWKILNMEGFNLEKDNMGRIIKATQAVSLASGDGLFRFEYFFDDTGILEKMRIYADKFTIGGMFSGWIDYKFVGTEDLEVIGFDFRQSSKVEKLFAGNQELSFEKVTLEMIEKYGLENIYYFADTLEEEGFVMKHYYDALEKLTYLSEYQVFKTVDDLIDYLGTVKYY